MFFPLKQREKNLINEEAVWYNRTFAYSSEWVKEKKEKNDVSGLACFWRIGVVNSVKKSKFPVVWTLNRKLFSRLEPLAMNSV